MTPTGEERARGLARIDYEFFSLTSAAQQVRASDASSGHRSGETVERETMLIPGHIRESLEELAALARRAQLGLLAHLIELTATEAALTTQTENRRLITYRVDRHCLSCRSNATIAHARCTVPAASAKVSCDGVLLRLGAPRGFGIASE